MATVTFILKIPSAKVETPIFMVFWINKEKIRLSTSEKIHPKYWNPKIHRARETVNFDQWESLNNRLDDIEKKVINKYREYLSKNKDILLKTLADDFKAIVHPITKYEQAPFTFSDSIEL